MLNLDLHNKSNSLSWSQQNANIERYSACQVLVTKFRIDQALKKKEKKETACQLFQQNPLAEYVNEVIE